jgi:hypothetical protein
MPVSAGETTFRREAQRGALGPARREARGGAAGPQRVDTIRSSVELVLQVVDTVGKADPEIPACGGRQVRAGTVRNVIALGVAAIGRLGEEAGLVMPVAVLAAEVGRTQCHRAHYRGVSQRGDLLRPPDRASVHGGLVLRPEDPQCVEHADHGAGGVGDADAEVALRRRMGAVAHGAGCTRRAGRLVPGGAAHEIHCHALAVLRHVRAGGDEAEVRILVQVRPERGGATGLQVLQPAVLPDLGALDAEPRLAALAQVDPGVVVRPDVSGFDVDRRARGHAVEVRCGRLGHRISRRPATRR